MKRFAFALFYLFITLSSSAENGKKEESPFSLGADLVSRYIFRGIDFGSSPAIQPSLKFSAGNFTVGAWGSYSFLATPAGIETDLFTAYRFNFGFTAGVTDYYFPGEQLSIENNVVFPERFGTYFNYSEHHFIEINTCQSLGKFDLSLNYGMINMHNALYLEARYGFKWVDIFTGAGNKMYSQSGKFNIVNIGISATKKIDLTKNYSFSLSTSLILNPNNEQIHLVFSLGL